MSDIAYRFLIIYYSCILKLFPHVLFGKKLELVLVVNIR